MSLASRSRNPTLHASICGSCLTPTVERGLRPCSRRHLHVPTRQLLRAQLKGVFCGWASAERAGTQKSGAHLQLVSCVGLSLPYFKVGRVSTPLGPSARGALAVARPDQRGAVFPYSVHAVPLPSAPWDAHKHGQGVRTRVFCRDRKGPSCCRAVQSWMTMDCGACAKFTECSSFVSQVAGNSFRARGSRPPDYSEAGDVDVRFQLSCPLIRKKTLPPNNQVANEKQR